MNAPTSLDQLLAAASDEAPRLREIPYNYTSFSDREIVIRLLGPRACRSWKAPWPRGAPPRLIAVTEGL